MHEQANHVHAQAGNGLGVALRQWERRRLRGIGLVVVAELVDVDAPEQHLSPGGVDDDPVRDVEALQGVGGPSRRRRHKRSGNERRDQQATDHIRGRASGVIGAGRAVSPMR